MEDLNHFDWAVIEIESNGSESVYCLCNDEEVAANTALILREDRKKEFRYEQVAIHFSAYVNY